MTQSTWRKIHHLGLVGKNHNDEEVKLFYGILDGFASLPIVDILAGMAYLKMVTPDGLEPFVNYINATYGSYHHLQIPQGAVVNRVLVCRAQHLCGMCMMQQYEESHKPTTIVRVRIMHSASW